RGRRHPLSCVILTGLCAVLTGARCLAAIGQWAANAPPHTLARLGARITDPALGTRQAPSPATIRRVLTALDPQTLTASPAAEDIAVQVMDGTSLRGSATRTTPAGDTAAHVRVEDKAGEIDAVADLLADIDITGCVISADALHTQRPTAQHPVGRDRVQRHARGAFTQLVAVLLRCCHALHPSWDQSLHRTRGATRRVCGAK
ncbi:transposase family protein, partial [Streptomonospora algeriensis]